VDASVETPHGPHPLRSNGTVSVPIELLREIGLVSGDDSVHWLLNPALPGTLVLIPSKMVARALPLFLEALGRVAR
jgi:hypothetical protein